jgi:hypothetical protein
MLMKIKGLTAFASVFGATILSRFLPAFSFPEPPGLGEDGLPSALTASPVNSTPALANAWGGLID